MKKKVKVTRDGSDLVTAKGRKVRLKIHFLGKLFHYLGIFYLSLHPKDVHYGNKK